MRWFLIVICLCSTLIISACKNYDDVPQQETGLQVFSLTKSLSGEYPLDQNTVDTLTTSDLIKHTFSDGQVLKLFAVGDHVFPWGGHTALTKRVDLPALVKAYESVTASVASQGVGLSPGATDINGKPMRWPSALARSVIYYEVGAFHPALRGYIDQAISEWNASSVRIKWQLKTSAIPYKPVSIVGGKSWSVGEFLIRNLGCNNVGGLSSQIGYEDPGGFPVAATIYINPDCEASFLSGSVGKAAFKRILKHEMGHIIGLWHEQQYCGRGNYVNVSGGGGLFDFSYIFNFKEQCNADSQNYGSYDFGSLMGYSYGQYGNVTYSKKSPVALNYCGDPNIPGFASQLTLTDTYAINTLYSKGSSANVCRVNVNVKSFTAGGFARVKLQAVVAGGAISDNRVRWTVSPNVGGFSLSVSGSGAIIDYINAPFVSRTAVKITATSIQDPGKFAVITATVGRW